MQLKMTVFLFGHYTQILMQNYYMSNFISVANYRVVKQILPLSNFESVTNRREINANSIANSVAISFHWFLLKRRHWERELRHSAGCVLRYGAVAACSQKPPVVLIHLAHVAWSSLLWWRLNHLSQLSWQWSLGPLVSSVLVSYQYANFGKL